MLRDTYNIVKILSNFVSCFDVFWTFSKANDVELMVKDGNSVISVLTKIRFTWLLQMVIACP